MITANDNGVLRTLNPVTANDGGVLHEMDTIHTNDNGVMREVFRANKGAVVSGITPLVIAEDHIVIVDSGTFTLSAPVGARIIVGGGAQDGWSGNTSYSSGGSGGYVAEYTLESAIKNAQCTLSIGDRVECGKVTTTTTTLTIDGVTYNSGSTQQIIQSKWGPIGGIGGSIGSTGSGAGGGGGAPNVNTNSSYGGAGGNYYGYGNKGQRGENSATYKYSNSGGSGGYSAGGGAGSRSVTTSDGYTFSGAGGKGGAGIIVIEW